MVVLVEEKLNTLTSINFTMYRPEPLVELLAGPHVVLGQLVGSVRIVGVMLLHRVIRQVNRSTKYKNTG